MNIAFVNSTRKWGGVKTWCINSALALNRLGHSTVLYGRPGPFPEKARSLGLRAFDLNFGFDGNPLAIRYFLKEFRKHNIELCICNISKDLRSAGFAARISGIPLIHRLGAPRDVINRFKTRMTQRLLSPRLLACSYFVRKELQDAVTLYNNYDFHVIHPGVLPAAKIPDTVGKVRTIIATSQLLPAKGHTHLLEALAAIKDKGLNFRCLIVGTGSEKSCLEEQTAGLGLNGLVEFTGFVTDVQAKLTLADIFVLPSFCEPLGIALEEAMAAGLVPVARQAGGVPEIWPRELPWLMTDPKEKAQGFAHVLQKLLTLSDTSLLEIKRQVYRHATNAFHVEKQTEKLAAWFAAITRQ